MVEDDTARFRILTVRFLQRDLGKLTELEKSLADDPANARLRSLWLQDLREYRDRVNRLYDEWKFRHEDASGNESPDTVPLARITRKVTSDGD